MLRPSPSAYSRLSWTRAQGRSAEKVIPVGGPVLSMPDYDFRATRLYVDAPLADGAVVALDRGQSHYLRRVLRLQNGQEILLFNGYDGEWRGTLEGGTRESALHVTGHTRLQTAAGDLHYLFAPLKSARLDYMVQ